MDYSCRCIYKLQRRSNNYNENLQFFGCMIRGDTFQELECDLYDHFRFCQPVLLFFVN